MGELYGIYEGRRKESDPRLEGKLMFQIKVRIDGETEDGYLVTYLEEIYNIADWSQCNFFGKISKKNKPGLVKKKNVKLLI